MSENDFHVRKKMKVKGMSSDVLQVAGSQEKMDDELGCNCVSLSLCP